MKRRRLIILLSIPVIIIGVGLLLGAWLLNSEGGARWILNRATNSLAGQLSYRDVAGNLGDGLVISDVQFAADGLEIVIRRTEVVVGISLTPVQVNVQRFDADGVTITRSADQSSTASTTVAVKSILASLKLPLVLNMENVEISDLKLLDVDQETLFQLDRVALAGRWKEHIKLYRLEVESASIRARAQGNIELTEPYNHQWTASGTLTNIELTEGIAATAELELELKGTVDDYRVELQAVAESVGLPDFHFAMVGQGDLNALRIESLEASSEFLDARLSGEVALTGPRAFTLNVEAQRVEPAFWIPDWPPEQYIYGRVLLRSENNGLRITELNAHLAGTDMSLAGGGLLDPQAGVVNARLSWQKLAWPVGPWPYEITSDSGLLRVSGSPSDWHFEGGLKLATRDYPGGNFELEGSGGDGSAVISIGKGEALGGTVAGQVSLDWRTAFRWNAELDVTQVDLGVLLDDWPVRLDAAVSLSQDTGKDRFELQFTNLHGDFQSHQFEGKGGLVFKESDIRFRDIVLHSDGANLSLDGDLADPAGLKFALEVQKSGWVADLVGGKISGRGRIALGAPQPVLDIELDAFDLAWGETRIESISISPGPDSSAHGLNLSIEASNLEFGSFSLQSVQAVLTGDQNRQALNINLNGAGHTLEAKLSGAISDWTALADSDWSGHLAALTLSTGEEALVTLQEAAPLTISSAGISLGQTCLGVSDSGGLCIEAGWQPDGKVDFSARLSDLSLGVLQLIHDREIEFSQLLNGEFQWTRQPGQYPSGRAAIHISSGQYGDELEESNRVTTAEGFFGFELTNGNLTAGNLDIPFPGIGQIKLDYAISGLALDGTGKVDGRIKIDLNDISVMEELLPGLDNISGQLNTDLQVSGVTKDPVLEGFVSLHHAAADIPELGIQLRRIRLDGTVGSNDKATLEGEFTAGEGQGKVSVVTEFSDWVVLAVEMSFSGSSLRLLNTPELRVDADPDFRLAWEKGEWSIDGGVVVTQARIAPLTSVVSKVTESEDIQLVAGVLPYGENKKTVKPIKLTGKLEVSLGDKVRIDTELAKATLAGAVTLTWNGELVPVANGSIHGDGTLSVFGPVLHVKDGQVRFPGTLVNKPMLDIRAERDIFGNTQIRTAGVSITGSAKRPVIEAYTNPLTSSNRAWALLITGSDVDYGQGVGAFEVGTYIAPRLYLSYGISLFDTDNVISARYDLKKGFGVKASSGQRESGIDMSYTIDH